MTASTLLSLLKLVVQIFLIFLNPVLVILTIYPTSFYVFALAFLGNAILSCISLYTYQVSVSTCHLAISLLGDWFSGSRWLRLSFQPHKEAEGKLLVAAYGPKEPIKQRVPIMQHHAFVLTPICSMFSLKSPSTTLLTENGFVQTALLLECSVEPYFWQSLTVSRIGGIWNSTLKLEIL